MAAELIAEYREVINGILYNTRVLKSPTAIITSHDPVRTPEQEEAREKRLKEALVDYSLELEKLFGFDWCMENIAERDRATVERIYAEHGRQVPDKMQKYLI